VNFLHIENEIFSIFFSVFRHFSSFLFSFPFSNVQFTFFYIFYIIRIFVGFEKSRRYVRPVFFRLLYHRVRTTLLLCRITDSQQAPVCLENLQKSIALFASLGYDIRE